MEREVRYCTTKDGVRIAYFVGGTRRPTLLFVNTIGLEDPSPGLRSVERFATVVRYHPRGLGLSEHDVADISLGARCLDIEAVLTHMRCERAHIVNYDMWGSILALAFAARCPDRVERMALYSAVASIPREIFSTVENLMQAFPGNLRSVLEAHGRSFNAWAWSEDATRAFVEPLCESLSANQFGELWRELGNWDVRGIIAQVVAPTLIMYVRPQESEPLHLVKRSTVLAQGREIINLLPHGRMIVVDRPEDQFQTVLSFFVEDESTRAAVSSAVSEVMGLDLALMNPASTSAPDTGAGTAAQLETATAFRTILFTDLVDHTLMMQRLGDEAGRAVLREHERITRDVLSQHGGIEVKTDGDSFMASFGSATAAVACAIELQRAFAERNETADEPIIIRAGLNVGEPLEEGGDYFGSAVILAARIKDQAGAGEILVPEAVRHLLSGKRFVYADRGEVRLKGFEDAVRLYEVRWQE